MESSNVRGPDARVSRRRVLAGGVVAAAVGGALAAPGVASAQTPAPTSVFNVKDYGALGNGTADEKTAIQAAIDAARPTGGIVYLSAGTYRITGPLLLTPTTFNEADKPIVLQGAGDASVIKVDNSGSWANVGGIRTALWACGAEGTRKKLPQAVTKGARELTVDPIVFGELPVGSVVAIEDATAGAVYGTSADGSKATNVLITGNIIPKGTDTAYPQPQSIGGVGEPGKVAVVANNILRSYKNGNDYVDGITNSVVTKQNNLVGL